MYKEAHSHKETWRNPQDVTLMKELEVVVLLDTEEESAE